MLSIYFIPPSGKIHTILESCFISPLFSNLDAAHKTLPEDPPSKIPSFFAIYLHIENASLSLHFNYFQKTNNPTFIFAISSGKMTVCLFVE
ncbi:hypothetical protein BAZSYMB_SCAFFOLD00002_62 [Bathymodiolus azoricus thioautotrophic gill symbiont]|uniref:Uncharacterized protein n=1 Tax=Bathymodiolus azoricus thioautotrophic gill symbiont TaxID=235205 RepID=A0A1H6LEF5_9GAMM|nr:hypothetical protein BAZSYMB_SCAFFOLD00002_62 [Bathymodiolus azoricus thioautotrophic gill symbiont]